MEIIMRDVGDVHILDMEGQLRLSDGTSKLRAAVRNALQLGVKNILLNMKKVKFIDACGLGELVSNFTAVSNEGGTLKLLNLSKNLKEYLAGTSLLNVFEHFDNEKKALESFR